MKVGFAALDITPSLGSERPAIRKIFFWDVHDPLHVKAAVLESKGVRVAFVGVDAAMIETSTATEGRHLAEKLTGIPLSHIMVAASHTHTGGPVHSRCGILREYTDSPNLKLIKKLLKTTSAADQNYLHFLTHRIGSAVALADSRKMEARCAVGIGKESTVSYNRRFKMKSGKQATHPGKGNTDIVEPAGPIDPDVGVLSAWDMNERFLGCVVNFACHGTTMGGGAFSADWPYYLDKTIRSVMGQNSTVVFLNGACGDITQVDNQSLREREIGEKWAMRVGQKVGAEALKVIAESEPNDLQPIDAARETINIRKRRVPPERLEKALALVESEAESDREWGFARDIIMISERNRFETVAPCEIQAIQIGPSIFVSSPTELFCQLGLEIKSASPFPYTFVVELSNGYLGYVPTEKAMGPSGGGYETRMGMHSYLVHSAGKEIVEASARLIERFTPSKIPAAPKVNKTGTAWDHCGPEEV